MDADGVEDVAQRLYGLLPEEFTAARDEAARDAKANGDRAKAASIAGLRRPSLAAWLVNALVRHRADEVEQLLALGDALRSAQLGLVGDEVRALSRQRQQLIAAVGRQARALARELGHPVSEDVGQEVEQTLGAAMADPAIAEAVRSGRLISPTSYAGLGTETTSGNGGRRLVPVPSPVGEGGEAGSGSGRSAGVGAAGPAGGAGTTTRRRTADPQREAELQAEEERRREEARQREEARRVAELEQARQEAREAQQAWEDAVATARAAQTRHDEAERAVTAARERIDELQDALTRAEQEFGAATREERTLRRERDAANRVTDLAGRAVQRARDRMERLESRS
jgi:hypothetical protein